MGYCYRVKKNLIQYNVITRHCNYLKLLYQFDV